MTYGSIYPPEAVAYYGTDFKNHAVTTGPYVVEEFRPTQRIVLRRNPNYRAGDAYPVEEGVAGDRELGRLVDAGKALPLNDRVVATVFKETTPLWLYFMRGYLDRVGIPKDNFASAIDPATKELIPEMRQRGVRLDKDARLEVIYDCFNMQDPVVGKGEKARAIRRAMSLAFDYEWARVNLYNDRVTRVEGPIIREFDEFDPDVRQSVEAREERDARPGARSRAKGARRRRHARGAGHPRDRAGRPGDHAGPPVLRRRAARHGRDRHPVEGVHRDLDRDERAHQQGAGPDVGDVVGGRLPRGAELPPALLRAQQGARSRTGPPTRTRSSTSSTPGPRRCSPRPSGATSIGSSSASSSTTASGSSSTAGSSFNLVNPWLHGYRYNDISAKYYKYCRVDAHAPRGRRPRPQPDAPRAHARGDRSPGRARRRDRPRGPPPRAGLVTPCGPTSSSGCSTRSRCSSASRRSCSCSSTSRRGDPALKIAGKHATPEELAKIRSGSAPTSRSPSSSGDDMTSFDFGTLDCSPIGP